MLSEKDRKKQEDERVDSAFAELRRVLALALAGKNKQQ